MSQGNEDDLTNAGPPGDGANDQDPVIIPLDRLRAAHEEQAARDSEESVQAREERPRGEQAPQEQAQTAEAGAAEEEPVAGELNRLELKAIIEALLFSTAEPLGGRKLAELAGARDARVVRELIEELRQEYDASGRAFTVQEVANGYQLFTRPDLHRWVNKLHMRAEEESISQAALETLAIIAYRQPVTRAVIEDIRGVQSGYILRSLIEKSLVRVTGRSEELGRPLLYGTTDVFLQVFGLASLKALPKLEELEQPGRG